MSKTSYPITLRFSGPTLKTQGVPILELGQTLMTVQRIVYKAYLFQNGRSLNTSCLKQDEREMLALGIASQEKGSDIYNLDWFAEGVLEDFPKAKIGKSLLEVGEVADLYTRNAIDPHEPQDPMVASMYSDLHDLTERIGSVGGISQLEIRIAGRRSPIVIDERVKVYVSQLKGEEWKSEDTSVKGVVVAPHTLEKDYAMVQSGGQRVKVYLPNKDLFQKMMGILAAEDQPYFEFTGSYRLHIGKDSGRIKEFDAVGYEQLAPGWPLTPEGKVALAGLHGKVIIGPPPPKPKQNNRLPDDTDVKPPEPKGKRKAYLN